jgi:hypothetical protein
MAVDLELLELTKDDGDDFADMLSGLISDAIVRTMGILAEHNRREFWVQAVQAQLEVILE